MTFEEILAKMLEKIPDNIDKREGSIIYNALAPAALEMALLYIELEVVLNETFADTQSREYLIKRATERGVSPYEATSSELLCELLGEVPTGSRFMIDDESFTVTARLSETEYILKADSTGIKTNKTGDLLPVEYIDGLEGARVIKILNPGADEEETEVFRKRYLSSIKNASFGGNQADYKAKVREIDGVGKVLVNPHYYGGGTVRIVITSKDGVPDTSLLEKVQNEVDPVSGEGLGIAPIGHSVTVEGAKGKVINIALKITCQTNYSFETVKEKLNETVDVYFKELSENWPDSGNVIVRVSQLEKRLLDTEGVLDITYTALNGSEKNLELSEDEIPVRGEISENE